MFDRFLLKATAFLLIASVAVLAHASPKPAGSEAGGEAPGVSERVFAVYYLPYAEASLLLQEKLGNEIARSVEKFRIEPEAPHSAGPGSPTGYVHVWGDADNIAKVAALLPTLDVPPPDQVFQVFLLEGSKQPQDNPDLPAGAARALQDVKEVLPFRGFRVLQSALIRSMKEGQANLGGDFTLEFVFRTPRDTTRPILFEQFVLRKLLPSAPPDAAKAKSILQTSFSITRGETVVVGTSKLDGGDQALVVLLTALK